MTQERVDVAAAEPVESGTTPVRLGPLDRLRARRRMWMAIRGVREFTVLAAVYVFYDTSRYLVAGHHDAAFAHARTLLRWEQDIDIDPEHALNNVFSAHLALGLPADYIYATLHYIITPAVLIWLWRRHPGSYPWARTVLIATTIIGLIGFSLVPVAPPRLLGGFIDTMSKFSHYGWWSNAGSAPRGLGHDTNQYAAMPSLHVGWAVWAGWQIFKHGRHRVTRWLGIAYPVVLSVVVMATANHYLLDVVGGLVAVGLGVVVAAGFTAVTHWIWPNRPPPAIEPAPPPRSAPA